MVLSEHPPKLLFWEIARTPRGQVLLRKLQKIVCAFDVRLPHSLDAIPQCRLVAINLDKRLPISRGKRRTARLPNACVRASARAARRMPCVNVAESGTFSVGSDDWTSLRRADPMRTTARYVGAHDQTCGRDELTPSHWAATGYGRSANDPSSPPPKRSGTAPCCDSTNLARARTAGSHVPTRTRRDQSESVHHRRSCLRGGARWSRTVCARTLQESHVRATPPLWVSRRRRHRRTARRWQPRPDVSSPVTTGRWSPRLFAVRRRESRSFQPQRSAT